MGKEGIIVLTLAVSVLLFAVFARASSPVYSVLCNCTSTFCEIHDAQADVLYNLASEDEATFAFDDTLAVTKTAAASLSATFYAYTGSSQQTFVFAHDSDSSSSSVSPALGSEEDILHVIEGEEIKLGEYAVIDSGSYGRILQLSQISSQPASNNNMTFTDVVTGAIFPFFFGTNLSGTVLFDGDSYLLQRINNNSVSISSVSTSMIMPEILLQSGNYLSFGTLDLLSQQYGLAVSGSNPVAVLHNASANSFLIAYAGEKSSGNGKEISIEAPLMSENRCDVTPPLITVISPQNITYDNATISLNLSSSESADCFYRIDGGFVSYMGSLGSNSYGKLISASNGDHVVNFSCRDSQYHFNNTQNIYFSVDASSNGSSGSGDSNFSLFKETPDVLSTNSSPVRLNCSASSANTISNITYYIFSDNSTLLYKLVNPFFSPVANASYLYTPLSEGIYQWYCEAFSNGVVLRSANGTFLYDVNPPYLDSSDYNANMSQEVNVSCTASDFIKVENITLLTDDGSKCFRVCAASICSCSLILKYADTVTRNLTCRAFDTVSNKMEKVTSIFLRERFSLITNRSGNATDTPEILPEDNLSSDAPPEIPSEFSLAAEAPSIVRTVQQGDTFAFSVKQESVHNIDVKSIDESGVDIEIRSDPITAHLIVNEPQNFDLDVNGLSDTTITARSIYRDENGVSYRADLVFEYIDEQQKASKKGTWLVVSLLLLLMVVVWALIITVLELRRD